MRIIDLSELDTDRIAQCADLLYESFLHRAAAWPDPVSAKAEVMTSLQPGKISRVALDDGERVVGWIGGQPQYDGLVWELHPLVVAARNSVGGQPLANERCS